MVASCPQADSQARDPVTARLKVSEQRRNHLTDTGLCDKKVNEIVATILIKVLQDFEKFESVICWDWHLIPIKNCVVELKTGIAYMRQSNLHLCSLALLLMKKQVFLHLWHRFLFDLFV